MSTQKCVLQALQASSKSTLEEAAKQTLGRPWLLFSNSSLGRYWAKEKKKLVLGKYWHFFKYSIQYNMATSMKQEGIREGKSWVQNRYKQERQKLLKFNTGTTTAQMHYSIAESRSVTRLNKFQRRSTIILLKNIQKQQQQFSLSCESVNKKEWFQTTTEIHTSTCSCKESMKKTECQLIANNQSLFWEKKSNPRIVLKRIETAT